MRTLFAIFLVVVVSSLAVTDDLVPPFANYDVSDERLTEIIELCSEDPPRNKTGLYLRDSKTDKWASGITASVYTPYAWLCRKAIEANRKFTPLTLEDLTDEMKRPVLRVKASPGEILRDRQKDDFEDYGMTRITIRSTAKKDYAVLEPLSVEIEGEGPEYVARQTGEQWFKATVKGEDPGPTQVKPYYRNRYLLFDLEQVAEISKLDKKGEVFIAFENALGKERKLKIKSKHYEKLP